MGDWLHVRDVLIPQARKAADPIAALVRLYETEGRDGLVAEALGETHEELGDLAAAAQWYQKAADRFPKDFYKQRATSALKRVRSTQSEGNTLYIVSCTKRKVWHDGAPVPRFVAAQDAYCGQSFDTWRNSPQARASPRWLILSAKYGFLDPDHPICDYDVTFSDPRTGPIDDATLAGQAAHQTRWADAVPLRDFDRVVVIGSREYLTRTRRAFEPLEIPVEEWDNAPRAPSGSGVDGSSESRAEAVGRALGELPASVYEAADRGEPEWPVLERIVAELPLGTDVILTLALALSDYQLGAGGAEVYWAEAERQLDEQSPGSPAEAQQFMAALMRRPVAARLAQAKLGRIARLLDSAIPEQVTKGVASVQATSLWRALTSAIGGDPNAKTIVFALKTVGLLHLCATGQRMRLPDQLPIPVDLRIARVGLAAGLIAPPLGRDVPTAMEGVEEIATDRRPEIIDAWAEVAQNVGLATAEMDSLIWQIAGPLQANRRDAVKASDAVSAPLQGYGAEPAVADRAAKELTAALAAETAC